MMSRKLALTVAPLLGFVLAALLMTASSRAGGHLSGSNVARAGDQPVAPTAPDSPGAVQALVVLSEGFEGATFPPADWFVSATNVTYTWEATTDPAYVHTGQRAARVRRAFLESRQLGICRQEL